MDFNWFLYKQNIALKKNMAIWKFSHFSYFLLLYFFKLYLFAYDFHNLFIFFSAFMP